MKSNGPISMDEFANKSRRNVSTLDAKATMDY